MLRVLMVDTEPHILALLKPRFEREGFEVLTDASDGAADLVIVGKRSALEGGQLERLQVPVILLSSSEDPPLDVGEAEEIAQLKMPFRPSQLVALARQVVARWW